MKGIAKTVLFLLLTLVALTGLWAEGQMEAEPKNAVLMIGDGMSYNHALLAGALEGRELAMTKTEYTAIVTTYSADSNVTDSAAAGTALATGYKTDNGMIGVTPEGEPVQTVAELLADNGYKTGVISTSRITHATPASFFGHNESRDNEKELFQDLVNSNMTLAIGGGARYFDDATRTTAKSNGFDIVESMENLRNWNGEKLLGMLTSSHFPAVTEREADGPYLLPELTEKALITLSKGDSPFFLMVEGSQIDWEGHGNDAYGVWKETIEFDNAVQTVQEFMQDHPDTLLVVTSDHETGGLGLSTGDYTFDIPMVRNYSAIADWLASNVDNYDNLRGLVERHTGVELSDGEIEEIKAAAEDSPYGAGNTLGLILSRRAHIGWTTTDHTGASVPLFAYGPGAFSFKGVMDNTEIPQVIATLSGYDLNVTQEKVLLPAH